MVSALKLFVPYHKNFHEFYDSKKVQNVGRGRSTTKSDDDKDMLTFATRCVLDPSLLSV